MVSEKKQKITFGKFENVDMRVGKITAASLAEGTRFPSRVMEVDLGALGSVTSIGQYALISEDELVGKLVVVCINLGEREMGPYVSQALILGVPHPESPADQSQAVPLEVSRPDVTLGSNVY